ncbi:hypothetical protein NUU61_009172 [Penicillium alfredii]|uniref:glycogenin glucosyltransferase n=1 Tax=Penicillium alfredii TaxID=1506179 RepID=A0A9W9EMI4_9EURO|nr:uncharacterized protein NUU61_009172 [Penicillium alfredii]KAJ5084593.1 hypothetical protein NUU61_009172 [Penicillium alfredii]
MASERDAVYCTLLLSDDYLPGAVVLAHSLRDNGTKAKLVALITPDTLQSATIGELRTVYDELVPVCSIVNGTPANLWLMERPDLIATFTKVELWRLTQYSRIVYIDCDVVALRAPDELLSLETDFAAAPDVGWPDCFNSGVMVFRPNLQDYYALKALAERGISFDGADQGLLNMHFRNWHRLSFTYNCTPSANYQYIPAYRHFQSTISLIHFIGSQKPWNLPRQVVPLESPYNQLLGRWWAIYDKHYSPPFVSTSQPWSGPSPLGGHDISAFEAPTEPILSYPVQTHQAQDEDFAPQHQRWPEPHHVHVDESGSVRFHYEEAQQDEHVPALVSAVSQPSDTSRPQPQHYEEPHNHYPTHHAASSVEVPVLSVVPRYVRGEEHVSTYIPPLPHQPAPISHAPQPKETHQMPPTHPAPSDSERHIHQPQPVAPIPPINEPHQQAPWPEPETPAFEAPKVEWDASREPPPLNSKPEGISLQQKTYIMSEDPNLFQPPPSYPEAPKNMYYQVPETKPEPTKVTQVFPWEHRAPKPTRIFADEHPVPEPSPQDEPVSSPPAQPVPTQALYTRAPYEPPTASWESYTRSNAWDEDPQIQRYIESIQQARCARTQVISGSSTSSTSSHPSVPSSTSTVTGPPSGIRPSIKLTDFPTEVERPSLPVTPAPIRRPADGGTNDGNDASHGALPVAEGVPSQEDWVGITVDVFSHLLRATYLLWESTESPGSARRAPSPAVRGLGDPAAIA